MRCAEHADWPRLDRDPDPQQSGAALDLYRRARAEGWCSREALLLVATELVAVGYSLDEAGRIAKEEWWVCEVSIPHSDAFPCDGSPESVAAYDSPESNAAYEALTRRAHQELAASAPRPVPDRVIEEAVRAEVAWRFAAGRPAFQGEEEQHA